MEHELFGDLHEQEEYGLFGKEHIRQYEAYKEAFNAGYQKCNSEHPFMPDKPDFKEWFKTKAENLPVSIVTNSCIKWIPSKRTEGSYRHEKCAAYQCNHPLDPPEWDCGYNTTIDCEECKYCIGVGGRKDPEAKCNQQK